jgi:hypothetical protein
MKSLILIVLGIVIPFWSTGQVTNPKGFVSLKILDDTLKVNANNWKRSIAFKVQNDSKAGLLVYGLSTSGFTGVPFESSQLCEIENVGLGFGLLVYDSGGAQLPLTVGIIDRFSDPPMTKSRLDSILSVNRSRVTNDLLILKSSDEKIFMKSVDLSPYELEKGTYFLQIVMYCGEYITLSVNRETIAADGKRSGADLYQGCSFSNMIRLIVE